MTDSIEGSVTLTSYMPVLLLSYLMSFKLIFLSSEPSSWDKNGSSGTKCLGIKGVVKIEQ